MPDKTNRPAHCPGSAVSIGAKTCGFDVAPAPVHDILGMTSTRSQSPARPSADKSTADVSTGVIASRDAVVFHAGSPVPGSGLMRPRRWDLHDATTRCLGLQISCPHGLSEQVQTGTLVKRLPDRPFMNDFDQPRLFEMIRI